MNSKEKSKVLAGMFQGATIENSQIIGIAESGSTIIYKKELKGDESDHFPLNSTKDEGVRIHDALINKSFMQVPLDSWLYLMGYVEQKPTKITFIQWLGTKEQLRQMLLLVNKDSLKKNLLSISDIERITPKCFIDKNKKTLELAKPKTESSQRMDQLVDIFRPQSTSSEIL